MMFWCHNCQQPIQSVQQIRCEICSCEAIEQISPENNPQNYQPYVSNQNYQQTTERNNNLQQRQSRMTNLMRNPFGMQIFERMPGMNGMSIMSSFFQGIGDNNAPVLVRYSVSRPVFGILLIDNQENQKTPVDQNKLSQLEKIQISQQCAICQEKQGTGLKLPCKHEFHEHCIKPWFQQTNTCPCCRTTV